MKTKFIILSILAIFSGCGNKEKVAEQSPAENGKSEHKIAFTAAQLSSMNIELDTIETGAIHERFIASGVLEISPQGVVSSGSAMNCFIQQINVRVGDFVQKGQVLGILEDEALITLQLDYLNAIQELEVKTKEYERQKTLYNQSAGTEKSLEQSKSAFQSQKNTTIALTEKLKLMGIQPETLTQKGIVREIALRSRVHGYVNKVNVRTGQYVNSGTEMLQILDLDEMYLNLTIFEKDMGKIKIGTPVTAYTNAQPDNKVNAVIRRIQPGLNIDHTLNVYAIPDKIPSGMMPGMFMNVEVFPEAQSVLTLPEEAVLTFEGQKWVFVPSEKNEFLLKRVTIGRSSDGKTEIISGLVKGDRVVVKGAYEILLGLNNKKASN